MNDKILFYAPIYSLESEKLKGKSIKNKKG